MKHILAFFVSLLPISTFALELINDFEWLEPNNRVEIVVGEPYQLKFSCSDNTLPFTNEYADSWNHYDFEGGQHLVNPPTGYSINDKGVITGLIPGSYAIKFTGWILPKSGVDKMLMITVVSERSETESNNTLDTANDISTKIRFGLYNISDVDYFKFTNSNLKWGDNVTFRIHYYGLRESPFGYKWATFCGTDMVGGGSLMSQDQECNALVTSGNTVYLEVYYDQSRSQYFNYGEEFVAEVYINGIPASEYGNDVGEGFDGEGTENAPYLIKNASNLKQLANNVNSGNSYSNTYFELSDNIDMTGEAFEPIGNQNNHFSGTFDGKGFVIKGISVNSDSYIGLFGYIENAFINDVGVEDTNYTGWSNIGGIAGYSSNSVITNCYSRGLTNGNDCVGALVGYSGEGTVIQNCFSSMQHTKYQIYGSVGGLVGYNCGKLENSYFYGTINAKIFEKSTTGGIVGYNHTTGSIHYCYFIKYGDVMNGEFNYCGSLNWGDCYGTDSFDLYGITTSGSYLHAKLNTWVDDHSNEGHYKKWTNESFPSFAEYAEPVEQNEDHEFVDLGLPSGLLWATTNIGAKYPEEHGDYYAWGETSPKSEYSWATYKYANGSENTLTKYCNDAGYGIVDYKEVLEEEDDAATVNWGKLWRTPTLSETQELISCCSWELTTLNGISGYKVTGANGNSIFLPAGGVMQYYWSYFTDRSVVMSATTFYYSSSASVLCCIDGSPQWWYGWARCWGYNVRPVYEYPTYKLTYIIDGNEYKSFMIKEGETITPEPAPTKEGYTFSGWSEIPEKMPAHDVTVTGTFSVNKYMLTYLVDSEEYKTYEVEYGAVITPEEEPTKEGYTFSGWNDIPETMPAHDVIVSGTFTINKYKLTYFVDGEVYKTYEVALGTAITPESEPEKEGYTFSGWSEIPKTMPAHDVTITGTFTVNKYQLTYIVDGEEYKTFQVEYGAAITPEPEPIKEGFVFSGWNGLPETMPAHMVIVTGTFSKAKYMLTYMVDSEVYKSQEMYYGAVITPEPVPTKEGHTFSGWSEIPATMPAHDVTVTGSFSVNKYILTYILDGKEYKTMEVEYGAVITPEPDPEKEGYTFSGWIGLPEIMPAKLVIVTGTFSINSYTLTYMIDEEVYKQVVYEYGAEITPEPQPEGDYVSFEWVGLPETMPAHDVTVTAAYETGIAEIMLMAQQGQLRIYSPNGKLLSKLQKGLNIVVMQDGTTKKVVVK
ncbi:MAG: InlB B-repeat-containing protein [Prevotella sp.]|nr:InlB B-repeat-containing protein [Prevotella sp.]